MKRTSHFKQMLTERNIREAWVEQTLSEPDRIEEHGDATKHFLKQIADFENRWLRIVVNSVTEPAQAVTAFFDRRLRGPR